MPEYSAKPLEGSEFADLANGLLDRTLEACAKAYAATQEPSPAQEVARIVADSQVLLDEYAQLCAIYTGGRLKAIQNSGAQLSRLRDFLAELRTKATLNKSTARTPYALTST